MHTCARVLSALVLWRGLWLGVFIVVCKYLQPFTLEKHTANQPFPQSSCFSLLSWSTPTDTHCHIPDITRPIPCLMAPGFYPSSGGGWIKLPFDVMAAYLYWLAFGSGLKKETVFYISWQHKCKLIITYNSKLQESLLMFHHWLLLWATPASF